MMLALGMFVFELRTLPYQSMQHSKNYRWVSNDRWVNHLPISFLARGKPLYSLLVRYTPLSLAVGSH